MKGEDALPAPITASASCHNTARPFCVLEEVARAYAKRVLCWEVATLRNVCVLAECTPYNTT